MLYFQQPELSGSNLLEHLLLESIGARQGGGIFAWVTKHGADTLIDNEIFRDLLSGGSFRLAVGTDTVTDANAVARLADLQNQLPQLHVNAFLNPGAALFHPKMCWFEHDSHLSLVVGSGNLTFGGLLGNWEAFTVSHLTRGEAETTLESINSFLVDRSSDLVNLSDPRVLARVSQNKGNERKPATPTPTVELSTEEVLVAQIPKSSNRWAQANFDVQTYVQFFGAKVGAPQRRIVLRHVDLDGGVGEVENRPSVEVKSDNYRFELAAARGIDYPANGRPIGVFLRQQAGYFLYSLILPGAPGFEELDQFLLSRWHGRPDRMRRIRCTSEDLRSAWPDSRLWTLADNGL
jgi:hypothetical protein